MRLVALYALILLTAGGLVHWYDLAVGDGDLPEPMPYPATATLCLRNTTEGRWTGVAEQNWLLLRPTLELLDETCPHVSTWVRQKQRAGQVRWAVGSSKRGSDRYFSTFNVATDELTIYKLCFGQTDIEKCCTLAHEWRHSRQNRAVVIREVMSAVFLFRPDETLVEDDADLYEHRLRQVFLNRDVLETTLRNGDGHEGFLN